MKSAKKIRTMLVEELVTKVNIIKSTNSSTMNYNEMLGDTSFLLAGLLDILLKKNFNDWDSKKWLDDSIITNVMFNNNKLEIDGVMIWGREDTTQQWVSPFAFEIELLKNDRYANNFAFFFEYCDNPEVMYNKFRENRTLWISSKETWKYALNSKKGLIW